jgi:serine protease
MATLVSIALAGVAAAQEHSPARRQPSAAADFGGEPRVLVKLRASGAQGRLQAQAAKDALAALAARSELSASDTRELGPRLHVMTVEPRIAGESIDDTLARLRADPSVEYAERDRRRYPHALPNDPLYTQQWYLQSPSVAASAIDAEAGWDVTSGSAGVVIAVIDTGVLFGHPDLARAEAGGRLLPGYDFVANLAAANDGNGRDADASDAGDWITAAEASSGMFSGCMVGDSSWHGTRVAGIVAARTNNAEGIAGTTWAPWILPVRALGKCGGFDSDILVAMLWAAGIHIDGVPDNPYPAKILNLSLGATGPCPAPYRDVIAQIAARGALVVVSAGNEGGPVDAPANCPGAAAVAGLRHVGTKVGYSSLGPEIAVSAPAGNCVNTTGGPCLFSIGTTSNDGATTPMTHGYTNQIDYNVGTSFSSPIVAAVAALMASVNGNLRPAQLIARLREGAVTPFPVAIDPSVPQCHVPANRSDIQDGECNCTTATCGAGMLNVPGALRAAQRPIAAVAVPFSVSAGQNVELSAVGSAAACDRVIASYAWSIVSGGSGTGVAGADRPVATVVAPTSGSLTVRLTVTDDASRQDTADVIVTATAASTAAPSTAGPSACPGTVTPPRPPIEVTVSPATASVFVGAEQAFSAAVVNALDASVTWRIDGIAGGNATVGTITAAGVYTAPATVPAPATVVVTAMSVEDPTRSASAAVTVAARVAPQASSGGGGGGGALDFATLLLALALLSVRRSLARR